MTALHAVTPEPEKPSAAVNYVTPEMARRWLEQNIGNRPFKKSKVEMYARDMAAGDWQITGEAIKFATDGRLIDGQNRLAGIIKSGQTVPMFVVRGIPPESQLVMDSGSPRNNADGLGFLGVENAKDVAPALTALVAWDRGIFSHCMSQSGTKLTRSELAEELDNYPGLGDITGWVRRVRPELPLAIGALAACAYRFRQIDADATLDFYTRIHELRTNGRGDPITVLIRRVGEERKSGNRLRVALGIYLQVRAWNAYRAGESLSKFQIGSEQNGWALIPEPR